MGLHVAIVWQRFLPYHLARLRRANKLLIELGYRSTAVEVASQDASYDFPEDSSKGGMEHICCFPGVSYHAQKAKDIYMKVLKVLTDLGPDVVFAPATPFPEGMAALAYRLENGKRAVIMDDAWEHTDPRGPVTNIMKGIIHRNVDGVFVPAPSHLSYYSGLGFSVDRIVFGVDVVDNDYYSANAEKCRLDETQLRATHGLPLNYFLFVGRFLSRKGVEGLIEAYKQYRKMSEAQWDLILAGDGQDESKIRSRAEGLRGVRFVGPLYGEELCRYYALARVLIVPSISDPWGLVINEGMACGLPVVVSRGCGAAKTLVHEGENGWTFEPGDSETLAALMSRLSSIPEEKLGLMGERSRQIMSEWSLDRFSDGVIKALNIPRRPPAGVLSNLVTKLWKGRVRTT